MYIYIRMCNNGNFKGGGGGQAIPRGAKDPFASPEINPDIHLSNMYVRCQYVE